jgi:hypothetical protein
MSFCIYTYLVRAENGLEYDNACMEKKILRRSQKKRKEKAISSEVNYAMSSLRSEILMLNLP